MPRSARFVRAIVPGVVVTAIALLGLMPTASSAAPATTPANQPAARRAPTPHIMPTISALTARRASARNATGARTAAAPAATRPPSLLQYGGGVDGVGVTTGPPQVYLVFWGSQWGAESSPGSLQFANDTLGVAPRLRDVLQGIGTNNEHWSGVATEYCEGIPLGSLFCPASAPHLPYPTGGVLVGAWADASSAVPNRASQADLFAESVRAAAHFGNTTPASNRNTQYVIVSPSGTHPDGFHLDQSFCAWHFYVASTASGGTSPYGDITMTNLPYIPDAGGNCGANFVNGGAAGVLDGVSIVEGHEYTETITDQLPFGGWIDPDLEEISDKCAWLTSGPGRTQNVAFATGSFAMQSNFSNDGDTCLITHEIWGVPGLPDSYTTTVAPNSLFATPGDSVTTTLTTTTLTGSPEPLSVSITGVPASVTPSVTSTSITSGDTVPLTLTTSASTALGVYPITFTTTGPTGTQQAMIVLTVGTPPQLLTGNVPVLNQAAPTGATTLYAVDVPADQTWALEFTTFSIGFGDVDLYVRRGTPPTFDEFDCSSLRVGNFERCGFGLTTGGRWYIMLVAHEGYAGVSLDVSYMSRPTMIGIGHPVVLSGAKGSRQYFEYDVPAGRTLVNVSIKGGIGDADMIVGVNALPNPAFHLDCIGNVKRGKPGRRSPAENCKLKASRGIKLPALRIYLDVYGASDYSGITLKGL